jgi:DNA mismatch repair protein MutS
VERVKIRRRAVARLDVLCSLAEVAVRNNYTMPEVDASREIRITEGRHPVVEQTLKDVLFVPNDTFLNCGDDRLAIVTGPNMAGKSTYMRQTALIVLMAQMGSFVPARSAVVGIVDRVFTRIGASDDLASGQSTFMVEMTEMANILKTPPRLPAHSRRDRPGHLHLRRHGHRPGGAGILRRQAQAGAKTMFATHYHELSALEGKVQGVKNYNITAKKQGGTLVFLRKIVPGAADDSYGIEVAKLAGVPDRVISRAREILKQLESENAAPAYREAAPDDDQISLLDVSANELRRALEAVTVETLTPIEALNYLYKLKQML